MRTGGGRCLHKGCLSNIIHASFDIGAIWRPASTMEVRPLKYSRECRYQDSRITTMRTTVLRPRVKWLRLDPSSQLLEKTYRLSVCLQEAPLVNAIEMAACTDTITRQYSFRDLAAITSRALQRSSGVSRAAVAMTMLLSHPSTRSPKRQRVSPKLSKPACPEPANTPRCVMFLFLPDSSKYLRRSVYRSRIALTYVGIRRRTR
jgi:hypothetical protein